MRDLLSLIFSLEGYQVTTFAEGTSFLAAARGRIPTCVLLDIHMPGSVSGLDVLKELNPKRYGAPVFMVSGRGDIPVAVDAIKNGAVDFIEKPFTPDSIVSKVGKAIETWRARKEATPEEVITAFDGDQLLTPREREVLVQIAAGASNKEAGRLLGISPRTIEVHRARIMAKLDAKNAADLMRKVLVERTH
jgi:FixJ family two-component response regulator